jgi:hypothetical protein
MRHRLLLTFAIFAIACCPLLLWVTATPAAQTPPPRNAPASAATTSSATTPRMADGHPDFNGFWSNPQQNSEDGGSPGQLGFRSPDGSVLFDFGGPNSFQGVPKQAANQPKYKPEYAAKVKAIADLMYGGTTALDPMVQCKPLGIPRGGFGTMQIVQTPKVIALVFEEPMNDRVIYTDGRQHPKDLDTSYMGDSIGHWEGDTLVVDVAGLNDDTWYAGGTGGNAKYSTIHSDQEHVTERWTRKANDITYEVTVVDPVMLAEPWVLAPKHVKLGAPDDYLLQFNCVATDVTHVIPPTDKDNYKCTYTGTRPECQ